MNNNEWIPPGFTFHFAEFSELTDDWIELNWIEVNHSIQNQFAQQKITGEHLKFSQTHRIEALEQVIAPALERVTDLL